MPEHGEQEEAEIDADTDHPQPSLPPAGRNALLQSWNLLYQRWHLFYQRWHLFYQMFSLFYQRFPLFYQRLHPPLYFSVLQQHDAQKEPGDGPTEMSRVPGNQLNTSVR